MAEHTCNKERELAELSTTLCFVRKAIEKLESRIWVICVVGGIIGGLLGKVSPGIFEFFVKSVSAGQ